MLYPVTFRPILKSVIWGGADICPFKGIEPLQDGIGESWELSHVEGNVSVVAEGSLAGKSLEELINTYGDKLLGKKVMDSFGTTFPLLIKFIDAKQDLSIQVHPDDELAMKRHQSMGKTEMWYIVDAEPDAKLIYGFKKEISRNEFERRITDNTLLDICNQVPVKKGDVFFIDSGTLHAIGKGILIAEIQQNSNTTYRVYDYGRVGKDGRPRELHVDKAIEVTKLQPISRDIKPLASPDFFAEFDMKLLAQCDPHAEMSDEDREWIDAPAVGKEIL